MSWQRTLGRALRSVSQQRAPAAIGALPVAGRLRCRSLNSAPSSRSEKSTIASAADVRLATLAASTSPLPLRARARAEPASTARAGWPLLPTSRSPPRSRTELRCAVQGAVPLRTSHVCLWDRQSKSRRSLDVQDARVARGGSPRQALDDRRDQDPCALLLHANV